jgi:hypothetical protein
VRPVSALQGIQAAAAKSINGAVQEEVLHKGLDVGSLTSVVRIIDGR